MAKLVSTAHFAASPEQVFDAFLDIEHWPDKIEGIVSVEMLTDGPVRVGTRFRETRIMFKKEATEEMEVTAMDRPHRFTIEAESCGAHFVTVHEFRPESNGTKVIVEFDATPLTFMAKLFSPLTGWMLKSCKKAFDQDLEDLRGDTEKKAMAQSG